MPLHTPSPSPVRPEVQTKGLARPPFAPIPAVNIHLHWLDLRLLPKQPGADPRAWVAWLADLLKRHFPNTCFEPAHDRTRFYDVVWRDRETRSWINAVPWLQPRNESPNARPDVMRLTLSGTWFADCPPGQLHQFLQATSQHLEFSCLRIDLTLDHGPGSPADFRQYLDAGHYVTASRHQRKPEWRDKDGHSCVVGTKGSGRRLVIYDEHGFNRVELQLRERWATDAFHRIFLGSLQDLDRNVVTTARGFLLDYIDFQEPQQPGVRPAWWSVLVEGATAIATPPPPRHRTIDKSIAYTRRQTRSLARTVRALAPSDDPQEIGRVLHQLFHEGRARLSQADEYQIQRYRQQRGHHLRPPGTPAWGHQN